MVLIHINVNTQALMFKKALRVYCNCVALVIFKELADSFSCDVRLYHVLSLALRSHDQLRPLIAQWF